MSFRGMQQPTQILLVLALVLLAAGSLAADEENDKEQKKTQTISIELDENDLVMTQNCGDDSRVVMVNMEAVEDLVADALADVSLVLDELDDLQMEFHLGEDNKLSFADEDSEWELDLGQIAMQLESAFREGFDEFDTDNWSTHHARYSGDDELKALEAELDSLKREMKRLEKQLEKQLEKDFPQEN